MIVLQDNLDEELRKYCGNSYSIGIHGIDYWRLEEGPISRDEQVKIIKNNIANNGFIIGNNRTLLGTVAFPSSEYDDLESFASYYSYGDSKDYIIIALPKTVQIDENDFIYLGYPDDSTIFPHPTQGYQLTSLSDALLPDYANHSLNKEFVYGTYHMIDGEKVELQYNQNHMLFNGGRMSKENLLRIKDNISSIRRIYNINDLLSCNKDLDSIMNDYKIIEELYYYLNQIEDYKTVDLNTVPNDIRIIIKNMQEEKELNNLIFSPEIILQSLSQQINEIKNRSLSNEQISR